MARKMDIVWRNERCHRCTADGVSIVRNVLGQSLIYSDGGVFKSSLRLLCNLNNNEALRKITVVYDEWSTTDWRPRLLIV